MARGTDDKSGAEAVGCFKSGYSVMLHFSTWASDGHASTGDCDGGRCRHLLLCRIGEDGGSHGRWCDSRDRGTHCYGDGRADTRVTGGTAYQRAGNSEGEDDDDGGASSSSGHGHTGAPVDARLEGAQGGGHLDDFGGVAGAAVPVQELGQPSGCKVSSILVIIIDLRRYVWMHSCWLY